jgi:hypothetical protein
MSDQNETAENRQAVLTAVQKARLDDYAERVADTNQIADMIVQRIKRGQFVLQSNGAIRISFWTWATSDNAMIAFALKKFGVSQVRWYVDLLLRDVYLLWFTDPVKVTVNKPSPPPPPNDPVCAERDILSDERPEPSVGSGL